MHGILDTRLPRFAASQSGRSWRSGYSLLELTAVLGVLGILAGVGTVRFVDSLHFHQCISAGQRITREIDNARRIAMLSSHPIEVEFDRASNAINIKNVRWLGDENWGDLNIALAEQSGSVQIAHLNIADGNESIVFKGQGAPPSSDAILVLKSGSYYCSVVVDSQTGRIGLHRGALRNIPGSGGVSEHD